MSVIRDTADSGVATDSGVASQGAVPDCADLLTPVAGPDGPGAGADGAAQADSWVTAWRQLAACHAATSAALEHELGERHGLGVSDFEVLERLAESESRKGRAQDLAEAVHLSQSALSRLVDRLAKHGLVERCVCDMDRRGVYVVLTEAGERRRAEALPTHRAVLARTLPATLCAAVHPR